MVSYDDVKNKGINLRREILKYRLIKPLERKLQLYDSMRSNVKWILEQLNALIDFTAKITTHNYVTEAWLLNKSNDVGIKAIEYNYNDDTMLIENPDNPDEKWYLPKFPQFKLTEEERDTLQANYGKVSEAIIKRNVFLETKTDLGFPEHRTEEDGTYYYYPDYVSPPYDITLDLNVTMPSLAYYGLQTDLNEPKVIYKSAYGYTVDFKWTYIPPSGEPKLEVMYMPNCKLTFAPESDPDNEYITTAYSIAVIINPTNVTGMLYIGSKHTYVKENKKITVLFHADAHGLVGIVPLKEEPL